MTNLWKRRGTACKAGLRRTSNACEIKLRAALLRAGAVAAIGAVAIGGLAGCSSDNGYEPVADPGYEQVEETPVPDVTETPVVEVTPDPVETEAPEVETGPELVAYADATYGDWISADDVEAARSAGLSIWVHPNGGPGLVVEPGGPIPDPIRETIESDVRGRPTEAQWNENSAVLEGHCIALEDAGLDAWIAVFDSGAGSYDTTPRGHANLRWIGNNGPYNAAFERSPYGPSGASTPEEVRVQAEWMWNQLEPGRPFPAENVIFGQR